MYLCAVVAAQQQTKAVGKSVLSYAKNPDTLAHLKAVQAYRDGKAEEMPPMLTGSFPAFGVRAVAWARQLFQCLMHVPCWPPPYIQDRYSRLPYWLQFDRQLNPIPKARHVNRPTWESPGPGAYEPQDSIDWLQGSATPTAGQFAKVCV